MEISKVGQARFMQWDEKMALDPNDTNATGMRAKTSNLNEDLGKVKDILAYQTNNFLDSAHFQ